MDKSYTKRLIEDATIGTNQRLDASTGQVYEKPLEHYDVNAVARKLAVAIGQLEARVAALEAKR